MLRLARRAVPYSVGVIALASAVLILLGQYPAGAALGVLMAVPLTLLVVDTRRRADSAQRGVGKLRSQAEKDRRRSAASTDALRGHVTASEQRILLAVGRAQEEVRRLEHNTLRAIEHAASIDLLSRELLSDIASLHDTVRRTEDQGNALHSQLQTVPQDAEASLQLLRAIAPDALLPPTGGWAMRPRNLLEVARLIELRRPMLVLELGSGSSTIWLGHMLKRQGGHLITVEHLREHAEQTEAAVKKHSLDDTVTVYLTPLGEVECLGRQYKWYQQVPERLGTARIDLLLVDGPPRAVGRRARFPAVPLLADHFADDAHVVLDDTNRENEREVARRWLRAVPGLVRVVGPSEEIAVLRYHRPSLAPSQTTTDADG